MELSALLPKNPACFQIYKPAPADNAGSKQSPDSNNALSSIAVYPTIIVQITPGKQEQLQNGVLSLPNGWRIGSLPECPVPVASGR